MVFINIVCRVKVRGDGRISIILVIDDVGVLLRVGGWGRGGGVLVIG